MTIHHTALLYPPSAARLQSEANATRLSFLIAIIAEFAQQTHIYP
jgi:hypothetical protein